ncbi:FecR domain-containing protein [Aeoliella mucimassa]|uniref:Fec operon regulator FecR n=1 Tax=Aeoliella mucimassa TaxID=2527972 RepID=A0A518AQE4_9BACT|nr:FecR domain-containing protein [Aeoliella mucimassa]QDU56942.1 fec operon regulator FecR [Aeoliella mucimassa]
MSFSPVIQRELNQLLAKAVDSELAPEERERLEQLVLGYPDRLRYMVDYLQLEVQLQAEAMVQQGVVQDDLDPPPVLAPLCPLPAKPRRWRYLPHAMIIAVSVAIVLGMIPQPSPPKHQFEFTPPRITQVVATSRPPAPVAALSMQTGAVWKEERWEEGKIFREGDRIELLAGEAQISIGCGAEIALKSPCVLEFDAHDRVHLVRGELAVHVAEWARGFTVITESMEVVDLGTTFTVSAGDDNQDETRVIEGLVRVHPRNNLPKEQRGLLVSKGESFVIAPDGEHQNQPLLPEVLAETFDFSSVVPYHPITLHNTGHGLAVGDEDPNWLIVDAPGGESVSPEYATVCHPDERYVANEPDLSQWVSVPTWRTAEPNSKYTFQTRFDLTGYNLSTIQLFGRFLADNGIQQVRVNGHEVEVQSWIDNVQGQEFGHDQFRFVDITDGLKQGENIVEIDVWNGTFMPVRSAKDITPNPMALRVEWYAFGKRTEEHPAVKPRATNM